MHRRMLMATGLLLLAGCASSGAAREGHARRGSADVITPEEIAAKPELTNAYEVVQTLRPQFLRSRGPTSFNATGGTETAEGFPTVFVDNQQFGNVASLRQIPISDVQEIRYVSAGDATTKWGSGYPNGVIQVVRRTR